MVPLRASTTKSESLPDDPTAFVPSRPWNLPSITTWDDSRNQNHPTDSAEEALFIPSTAPLETRCLVHDRIPSRWVRSMRTNFLKGSNRDLIAECIHFSRWSFARLGCL